MAPNIKNTTMTLPRKPNRNTEATVISVPGRNNVYKLYSKYVYFYMLISTFNDNKSGKGHDDGNNSKHHEHNEWKSNR